jgi:hypothetical protein
MGLLADLESAWIIISPRASFYHAMATLWLDYIHKREMSWIPLGEKESLREPVVPAVRRSPLACVGAAFFAALPPSGARRLDCRSCTKARPFHRKLNAACDIWVKEHTA